MMAFRSCHVPVNPVQVRAAIGSYTGAKLIIVEACIASIFSNFLTVGLQLKHDSASMPIVSCYLSLLCHVCVMCGFHVTAIPVQVRAAIGSYTGAKLIIVEACIASKLMTTTHTPRHTGDVHMMVQYGDAKERSDAQFAALLTAAGFKLQRLLPTKSLFFVLEAVPV
jgi:hypothetical protein